MNLLRLLLLKARKRPTLSRTQDSVATPLGHVPYRNPTTMQRDVNTHASLDEGVRRAKNTKCYSPRVEDE